VFRLLAIPILCLALALVAAGCGDEGASEGATLTVYVSAPLRGAEADQGKELCDETRAEARGVKTAGDHQLRVVCLDASGEDGVWTLAKVGSNARRATEDSTTVAYVGEPSRAARKQSQPIVEAAEIATMGSRNGKEAVETIVTALKEGESDDPRRTVLDAVEG
jgi:branched-chain amino acid transport system substrate-binding protein